MSKFVAIIEASRPLLWLFSITSSLCGMFMAVKGIPPVHLLVLVAILVGPCITATLNLINSVFDIEVDKLSKPGRPLPTGRIGVTSALATAFILCLLGLILAFTLGILPFILALTGVILATLYSTPLMRIKSKGILSNFSLALGYTTICFLFGWSIFQEIQKVPWFIPVFMTLQVTGANIVKDFVDYEADEEMKIGTLPVRYGVKKSIILMSPLFVGIYLAIPLYYLRGNLSWIYLPISLFSVWGLYIANSLTRNFSRRNREKAFVHAFLMSLFTEIAFAIAYITA